MPEAKRPLRPGTNGNSAPVPTVAGDWPDSLLAPAGLVSILIPCCWQLEYTKLCVQSLFKYSRLPYELIFVDIGSLDGTADYLDGVATGAEMRQVRVEVLRTPTDLGIAQAVQEALDLAHGEYLVLLHNDTVVPEGWLDQMVALARSSAIVGLVGPMSNHAPPSQLVETVPYRVGPRKGAGGQGSAAQGEALVDVSAVQSFARDFRQQHKGKWAEVERLGAFCLLLKREALLKLGSLPEAGMGLFDTDILSLKARQAGYKLACARDLFIHHFGT